jgi:hypothetical protein
MQAHWLYSYPDEQCVHPYRPWRDRIGGSEEQVESGTLFCAVCRCVQRGVYPRPIALHLDTEDEIVPTAPIVVVARCGLCIFSRSFLDLVLPFAPAFVTGPVYHCDSTRPVGDYQTCHGPWENRVTQRGGPSSRYPICKGCGRTYESLKPPEHFVAEEIGAAQAFFYAAGTFLHVVDTVLNVPAVREFPNLKVSGSYPIL